MLYFLLLALSLSLAHYYSLYLTAAYLEGI